MTNKARPRQFRFTNGFSVGSVAAENDMLLGPAFLPNAAYAAVVSLEDPRSGLIGRSGTGKTAILEHISDTQDHVIRIDPEALAFRFLGDSLLIRTLRDHGIELDYFYKLLWRHVFVVEVLKHFFPDGSRRGGAVSLLMNLKPFKGKVDRERRRALQYLDEWGASILQVPEERIRQIHQSLEDRITKSLGAHASWSQALGIEGHLDVEHVSKTEIEENVRTIKHVVNQIQVEDLNAVRDLLGHEVLSDRQKPCYVLIDDLDRFWVDDQLMYELIRGLILEIYEWRSVANIKFVYALRDNILSKIETDFRSRAYQKEKLEDQRFHMTWQEKELENLIDERLQVLANDQKAHTFPSLRDILPKATNKLPSGLNYVLHRTMARPRDIIDFVNRIGSLAIGKERATYNHIKKAEIAYSDSRLTALLDEWRENFAGLDVVVRMLLRGRSASFALDEWTELTLVECFFDRAVPATGWASKIATQLEDAVDRGDESVLGNIRRTIASCFYEIGAVGLRQGEGATVLWGFADRPVIDDAEISEDCRLVIHPMLHLGLRIGNTESIYE